MRLSTLIHIAGSALKYKVFKIRTPIVLSISITSRCNLRCTYCYSLEDNRLAKDVPLDEILRTIDEFHNLGTRVVMLQGGEPLLHKDLDAIVDHVKSRNMYCAITTNSIHFEKHLATMKKVDQVQLSIDGDREITDRNRGAGVYDSIVEAAKLCHEHKIHFHLHIVVTKDTTFENTLRPLTALAQQYKTYLNFCIPNPTGSALGKDLVDHDHIRAIYQRVLEEKGRGLPTNNSLRGLRGMIRWGESYPYGFLIPAAGHSDQHNFKKCVMGNLVCWLDSDGRLHPCAVQFGQSGFSYSIKEFGVAGAWQRLQKLPCHFCANSIEFNNLFHLDFGPVINSLKYLSKRS